MSHPPVFAVRTLLLASALLALAGCERNPLLVQRSSCAAVAVPTYAGDVTLFNGASADANAIDVEATITNVRDRCSETPAQNVTDVTYDVVARRTSASGARSVVLPVFASVIQGGNLIVSKQVGNVTLAFADGQTRAVAHSGARGTVSHAEASLPPETLARVNRKRKPGDLDAAVDPMSDPEIKAALRAASFELLIGFQLDDRALAYNITK